ncbi:MULTISPECIES: LysR family transcriptional regulator [unclassified Brenneria]|uniref:LysR family transcriptional regulator n=1 Tax=unclassified Brenneria TaxID=2634434 RepID=UPI001551F9E5|nr:MULTISPECIES: LysR family transcriptional regulator [unclassified Brenneria]MBJ7221871.1 LysR family transcriptional regulator [Brenneria sp. L3-3C-1]MEE3643114.1 LysR family transcriptional regulator [Brenneria sp. L3_3C_1]MEE3650699.1 LysR family transcriptional regulator [Brenneria sp. HEZEL_4_2_4]NPD00654.1 LysR family transcriptional regulator [Brenneria sp. hezel4-2-4]
MRFDLTDLRLFLHIQKAGSITGGAVTSNLTLQAASERVRGMENELGVPLLLRSKNGVTLTEAGYSLVHHATIILHQVEHMRSELHQYSKGLRGHIPLLCNSAALSEYLPELLGQYLLIRPNISIAVNEQLSRDIVNEIKNQTADLGIVADTVQLNGLETRPFRQDELVAVVPGDSRWAQHDMIAFEAIVGAEFIGLSAGYALQEHIDEHARKLGRRLNYRVRLASFDAVMHVIQRGIGVGILPRHAANRMMHSLDIHCIGLSDVWAKRNLVICARRFSALPGYFQEFVEFITLRQKG